MHFKLNRIRECFDERYEVKNESDFSNYGKSHEVGR